MADIERAELLIQKHLDRGGIKKDKDVEQLYLSDENITDVADFSRFKHLKYLWLNGNKLRRISCLGQSYHLAELYLQNNQLVEIIGALQHLTCLQVLMLQNNQLTNLQNVIHEFRKMSSLDTLNMFNNPVAQEPDYRIFVIRHIPSVQLLDRQEVSKAEVEEARQVYDQERETVKRTIAFGRRAGQPIPRPSTDKRMTTQFITVDTRHLGDSYFRDNPPFESADQAILARRMRNSVSFYTYFDWSKLPRLQERRMADRPFDSPELVTHVYR